MAAKVQLIRPGARRFAPVLAREKVKAIGANGMGQIEGVVDGVRYRLGLNAGHVGQFFPLP